MRRRAGGWRVGMAALVGVALCAFTGKVTPWTPGPDSQPALWTYKMPKGATFKKSWKGPNFFALSFADNSTEKSQTVWINGAVVWQGDGETELVHSDKSGNWIFFVYRSDAHRHEIFVNGESKGLIAHPLVGQLLLTSPKGDEFAWIQSNGAQPCLMKVEKRIACLQNIRTAEWTATGIYLLEETDKLWTIHRPNGTTKSLPTQITNGNQVEFDDLGVLWWSANGRLLNDITPEKTMFPTEDGWTAQISARGSWPFATRKIANARTGGLLRRDQPARRFSWPWERPDPLSKDSIYPEEYRFELEWGFVCAGAKVTVPLQKMFSPKKRGLYPGQLIIAGAMENRDEAVFLDCSGKTIEKHKTDVLPPLNWFHDATWLGKGKPPFLFLRFSWEGWHAVSDFYSRSGLTYWTDTSPPEEMGGGQVWLNGPPYWAGWWVFKNDKNLVTVSWETRPLETDEMRRQVEEARESTP